jgi:hypothetical protein
MNRQFITLLIALLVFGFSGTASAHHVAEDGVVPAHAECEANSDGACPESDASEDTVQCGALVDGEACNLGAPENSEDEDTVHG